MKKLLIISAILLVQNALATKEMAPESKRRTDMQDGGMRITGYRTTKGVADDLNGTFQMPTVARGTNENNNEEENMEEETTTEPESKRSTASIIRGGNGNDIETYGSEDFDGLDGDME